MSYVRIWVHLVFSTKRREPLLPKEARLQVQRFIMAHCREKQIFLQAINGYTDHLHCLLSLKGTQTIADVAKLIKGASSFWINNTRLIPEQFAWQDDYYAVSVSESFVPAVVTYIKNQEAHHATQSLEEEMSNIAKAVNNRIHTKEIYGKK